MYIKIQGEAEKAKFLAEKMGLSNDSIEESRQIYDLDVGFNSVTSIMNTGWTYNLEPTVILYCGSNQNEWLEIQQAALNAALIDVYELHDSHEEFCNKLKALTPLYEGLKIAKCLKAEALEYAIRDLIGVLQNGSIFSNEKRYQIGSYFFAIMYQFSCVAQTSIVPQNIEEVITQFERTYPEILKPDSILPQWMVVLTMIVTSALVGFAIGFSGGLVSGLLMAVITGGAAAVNPAVARTIHAELSTWSLFRPEDSARQESEALWIARDLATAATRYLEQRNRGFAGKLQEPFV